MSKILLIEDEKAMSDLIALKFSLEGFEVIQAVNLTEAAQKLVADGPFDAILTDFILPEGDSTEFLVKLKSDPKTRDLPVLVMTNYVEDVNMDKLKEIGVDDVMVKYQLVPAQMAEKMRKLLASKNQPHG